MSPILAPRAVRIAVVVMAVAGVAACADASLQPGSGHGTATAIPETPAGTPHDFDVEHGRWRTTLQRLLQPLSGTQQWANYTGISNVQPLLDGSETSITGPAPMLRRISARR